MWPFSPSKAPADSPRTASLAKRVDDLELEGMELRESLEKTLTAVKKIQGRLIRRVQLAEDAEAPPADATDGAEPLALPINPKAALRQAAARLRASRP